MTLKLSTAAETVWAVARLPQRQRQRQLSFLSVSKSKLDPPGIEAPEHHEICCQQFILLSNTYDVDELNHGQSKLDGDNFAEVDDRSNEWIVAVTVKQRVDKSNLVCATQTCQRRNRETK